MQRLIALSFIATTLTACSLGGPGAELASVLPDERIQINMKVDSDLAKDAADGEWSEAYLFTAQVTDDVNAMIAFPLILVEVITQTRPSEVSEDGSMAIWGPYGDALDPTDTLLTVEHDLELDTYTWAFTQKPKGADDSEYVPIIVGEVDAGATDEVHSGRFTVDFTAADLLDPNVVATGTFSSDYDVREDGVTASATYQDFLMDGAFEPIDAMYIYDQTPEGAGVMDLGWLDDVNGDGEDDSWVVRSRWTEEGAGRSDSLIAAGGEALVYMASECWDGSFNAVYSENSWAGEVGGDAGACAFEEASYPEE
jgi:hypothetical protein